MKITHVKTRLVEIPLPQVIETSLHSMRSVGCVLLSLHTDEGLIGEGFVFTLNAARLRAYDEMIRGFDDLLVNKNPYYVEKIWQDIWREINPSGHKGVTISALSSIDTALWDIIGKANQQPLYKLFGARRERIRTYASGGLWLSQTIDELLAEGEGFTDQGFRAMKIRIGSDDTQRDIERVRVLRESLGDDIELMADANQAFDVKQAIRLGRELEPFNLTWLEEPVVAYDLEGHRRVRDALDTPIASGETEYTRQGMKAMIQAGAMDILMPDLQRIGGLSEMRVAAHLAASFNVPISPHFFTEYSLCIAGSIDNCISLEHIPWFAPLFNENMELREGCLEIPDRPGTGFSFNPEAVEHFHID